MEIDHFVMNTWKTINGKTIIVQQPLRDDDCTLLIIIVIYYIMYFSALQDATDSLKLKPDWPKGFFRKAKALAGLKVSIT